MLREPRRLMLALVVGALALILGALASTSTFGEVARPAPVPTVEVPSREPLSETPSESTPTPLPAPRPRGQLIPDWLRELLRTLGILVLAAAALAFLFAVLKRLPSASIHRAAQGDEGVEIADVDEAQVLESVEQTLDRLRSGVAVDDAIVECWRRLERLAAQAGVSRHPSQTSEEFTLAVLGATSADASALKDLGELYRTCVYSDHVLAEDARERAVIDLERLRESLVAAS